MARGRWRSLLIGAMGAGGGGAAAALFVVALLMGCEVPVRGIYAQIAESSDIPRPNAGERGYATSMLVSDNRYYATAKGLYWRNTSADGQDWNRIGLPGGFDIATAIRAVQIDTNSVLLVAMASSMRGQSALYQLNVDGDTHTWSDNLYRCNRDDDGGCGAEGADASLTTLSEQIVWMDLVSGPEATANYSRLFVLARGGGAGGAENSYTLYYYNHGGDVSTANDRLHTVWRPVSFLLDVDRIGDFTIFADRTGLYCVRDPGGMNPTLGVSSAIDGDGTVDGTQPFILRRLVVDGATKQDDLARVVGGLLVRDDTIHVSGGNGQIFRYRGSGAVCASGWKGACSGDTTSDCWARSKYDGNFRYTDMAWFPPLRAGGIPGMVIGVEEGNGSEGGYREITRDGTIDIAGLAANSATNPNNANNYRSTQLAVTTVRSFFVNNNALFALTDGYGVWRASYINGVARWVVDLSR